MSKLKLVSRISPLLSGCRSFLSLTSRPDFLSKCRYSSTGTDQKLYEIRTYTVKPDHFKIFIDLSTEWMHLRTSHSKLVGYWITEIGGGIHEVVHIWEYDSLSHRASVRQALAKDEVWVKNYFSKLLTLLQRQDNGLLRLFPGVTLKDPPSPGGAYQLETFSVSQSKIDESGKLITGRQKPAATQLGAFYAVLGMNCFGYQLWHHPTVDNLLKDSQKNETDTDDKLKGDMKPLQKTKLVDKHMTKNYVGDQL